ncbi:MAG TPA: NrfD/PsrC family molybdoenzyme membrane anchor subunit, partial [Kofleriaceae bacterium]|nr:NrfD/PsrC family molybdoenzyme membrane anchor subunit [Kofleriaceae bacterium]
MMTTTYHDLPVVKPPPWRWFVPAYFYAGGVAGAAATLAAITRDHNHERRLHWIATLGEAAGSVLLVADLGRPMRAHHMLRVFRPRSPMNVGSWILGAAGVTGIAALAGNRFARRAAAIPGAMLTTYTGVLLGNTAIPIWHATRTVLPPWFAACAAASVSSVLELVEPKAPRTYSIVAKTAELAGAWAMERTATRAGVGAPFREGRSG